VGRDAVIEQAGREGRRRSSRGGLTEIAPGG